MNCLRVRKGPRAGERSLLSENERVGNSKVTYGTSYYMHYKIVGCCFCWEEIEHLLLCDTSQIAIHAVSNFSISRRTNKTRAHNCNNKHTWMRAHTLWMKQRLNISFFSSSFRFARFSHWFIFTLKDSSAHIQTQEEFANQKRGRKTCHFLKRKMKSGGSKISTSRWMYHIRFSWLNL